jgi:photosystem II stability/assembly factor-like uncharacterized protein
MLVMSSSAWAGVTSMTLLAPNVGWAEAKEVRIGDGQSAWNVGYSRSLAGTHLFWTMDGGAHWRDITPNPFTDSGTQRLGGYTPYTHGSDPESIADVFFRDTHRGWVLLCCRWDESAKTADANVAQYDLAMTADSGTTWSIAHVTVPKDARVGQADGNISGQVVFADSLHGWINLTGCATHSCASTLLATSDGGRTWRITSDDYVLAGAFSLVTSTEGWQLSPPSFFGPDTWKLYVTRDGAKSWKEVSVPIPREILRAAGLDSKIEVNYHDLPTFEDSKHGFLPVTYMAADWKSVIVLFETADGGRSWKPVRTITNLYINGSYAEYDVAVADRTLMAAVGSRDDKRVTLSRDGADSRTDTDITDYVERSQVLAALSFASPKQGWMLGQGMLWSTTDGGVTWTMILPMSKDGLFKIDNVQGLKPSPSVAVESMQLLTSDIGWTLVGGKLYWTESGGDEWKDISPPGSDKGGTGLSSSVFFLDSKRGWVLLWDGSRATVFSTTDAGADWSIANVTVPDLQGRPTGNRSAGQIYFLDSLHGWMSLDVVSGPDINQSKAPVALILVTSDGGRTWNPTGNDLGAMGYLRFTTPSHGWMLIPTRDELFVTYDGAKSWQKVSLAAPKEAYPATEATYDLPTFEDNRHGFLPVTYSGGLGVKSATLLFATEDGGQTWQLDRTLAGLSGMPVGTGVSSAVTGPAWIAANLSGNTYLTISAIASGATANASSNVYPGYYGVFQLSFVTPSRGWVLLYDGSLLSTMDGGTTWAELILGQRGHAPAALRQPAPSPRMSVSWTLTGTETMQLLGPAVGVVTAVSNVVAEKGKPHLFRTEDDGARWKEISPVLDASDSIVSKFFFLDAQHGWVVLLHWGPVAPTNWFWRWWHIGPPAKTEFGPSLELVSTADSGSTWSLTRMEIPELDSLRNRITSTAEIAFTDLRHGWMTLTVSVMADPTFRWDNKLLMTSDGGKSWRAALNSSIQPAAVRFVTPMEGWMVGDPASPAAVASPSAQVGPQVSVRFRRMSGGPIISSQMPGYRLPAGSELYVTRNGAKSWLKVSLETPKEVYSDKIAKNPPKNPHCVGFTYQGKMMTDVTYPPPTAIFNLPTFTDSEHGFLPVTYSGTSGIKWQESRNLQCQQNHYHAVLFATGDGGRTWHPDRMLFSTPEGMYPRCTTCTVQSAVVGSTWILANYALDPTPSFITLGPGASVDSSKEFDTTFWPLSSDSWTRDFRFGFATPAMGWITWRSQLLSTTNGGGTWTPITPKSSQSVASP